jgi:hypothetical protein
MTTTTPIARTRLGRPLAIAAAAAGAMAAYAVIGSAVAGPAHSAPSPHTNLSGTYKIASVGSLSPGATYSSWWNNTPFGRSYFVEARPGFSASGPCAIEVTREYNVRTINGSGNPELEVHYSVKNVGSVSCGTEVWLAYVA